MQALRIRRLGGGASFSTSVSLPPEKISLAAPATCNPPGLTGFTRSRTALRLHHGHAVVVVAEHGPAADDHQQPAADAAAISASLRVPGPCRADAAARDRWGWGILISSDTAHPFRLAPRRGAYRISSTGMTPITARPERIITAVAATNANRASVSAGRSGCRKRSVAASLPRFHSI